LTISFIEGYPIIRPLLWLSPEDETTHTIWDQYAIGDKIIVAPVMAKGQTCRDVYLPHTTKTWQEISTGIIYEGGKWHQVSVSLNSIPIFLLQ
jgi:alpha-glucosidase (family GH31 glycosyl hydrolase)